MKGILGRKIGMTQVFTKSGKLIPVTVVAVEPNVVTQIKTTENDGYEAIQLGFDTKREKLATKASLGHTNKANTTPKRFTKEIRGVDVNNYELGQIIKADIFAEGDYLDITGTTKGRGFAGVVKRYRFGGGRASHGGAWTRRTGSIGCREFPGNVVKGKKMPGHMGNTRCTMQNLKVVRVMNDDNVILVKGAIPGANGGILVIRSAVKKQSK